MRHTILAIILVVLVGATIFVWYAYLRNPVENQLLQNTNPESERLQEYRRLKDLKPDMSIFTDPLFQSLGRFRASASSSPPVPGRTNPFVPF